ncbi:MAG: tetratricopeptide repeat protein [bacterium]
MKYILCVLLLTSQMFGNEELNEYLNNKDLKSQIIKDKKGQRIIIDFLYDDNRVIIFNQNKDGEYQKSFDEKLYFCLDNQYSNIMLENINDKIQIVCLIPNVDGEVYRERYLFENLKSLKSKLVTIELQYVNRQNDSIKKHYIFQPTKDVPILRKYKDKSFSDDYLFKNKNNFIELDNRKNNICSFIQKYSLSKIEKNLKQKKDLNLYNKYFFQELLPKKPIEKKNIITYNNIAYYLQKAGANEEAVYLLEKILEKYPNRTVAHYNLADAYWELGEKKRAVKSYNTYIEQMCNAGKEKRIPQVVIDRASTKL